MTLHVKDTGANTHTQKKKGKGQHDRRRGEPFSCRVSVNLTNLIQLAKAGDSVIKSTQVTNGGESNYFTKK